MFNTASLDQWRGALHVDTSIGALLLCCAWCCGRRLSTRSGGDAPAAFAVTDKAAAVSKPGVPLTSIDVVLHCNGKKKPVPKRVLGHANNRAF